MVAGDGEHAGAAGRAGKGVGGSPGKCDLYCECQVVPWGMGTDGERVQGEAEQRKRTVFCKPEMFCKSDKLG